MARKSRFGTGAICDVFGALWICRTDSPEARAFRLQLSKAVGQVLQSGMGLLGVEMPGRM